MKRFWQMFADGAGSGAAGAVGGSDGGAASPDAQQIQSAQPVQGRPAAVQDTGKEFTDFMRSHKEQADAWFQERFDKRHKEAKGNAERLSALEPVLRMLGDKYGWKSDGDINDLVKAIRDDDSYYEEESIRTGIPVEQLKQNRELQDKLFAMERERDEYKSRLEQDQQAIQRQQFIARLQNEVEQVKSTYPSFDLETEMQNSDFNRMVRNQVSLMAAYQAVHFNELQSAAMQYTAGAAAQKIAASVATNARRPRENGGGGQAAGRAQFSVDALSKAEFEALKTRARRGEKISF